MQREPVHESHEQLIAEGNGELSENSFQIFDGDETVQVLVECNEHTLHVGVVLAHLKHERVTTCTTQQQSFHYAFDAILEPASGTALPSGRS